MGSVGRSRFAGFILALAVGFGSSVAPAEPVKVGVLLPLTGADAEFGEMEKRSFEMAAEEINARGGIAGKRLELLFEDDAGKPDAGRSAAERLISREKVPVLAGGHSSSVAAAVAAVAQQFRVPFLVVAGSADKITMAGYRYVFRIHPPAGESPATLAGFLQEVARPKTAVVLHENSLFGRSRSKSFEKECERLAIRVLAKEGYDEGAVDFRPLLTKVKAMTPDLVYMVSLVPEAALLMRQAAELDLNPRLFVGEGDGFSLPGFRKRAEEAAEFVYAATLWAETVRYPGASEFARKYRAKYRAEADSHGAAAYAATYVIADALERAGNIAPETVRDALARTDMMTVFGPVRFLSYGKMIQQNRIPALLIQWQKGVPETVWPRDVAGRKYIDPVPKWSDRK